MPLQAGPPANTVNDDDDETDPSEHVADEEFGDRKSRVARRPVAPSKQDIA